MRCGPGAAEVDEFSAYVVEDVDVADEDAQPVEVFQVTPDPWYLVAGEGVLVVHELFDDGPDRKMPMFFISAPWIVSVQLFVVASRRVLGALGPSVDLGFLLR